MSPLLLGIIASLVAGNAALTVDVLEPINNAEDIVALIFIPEVGLESEQYRKIGQAIQEASKLQVWVALTGGYVFNAPNIEEIPTAVQKAMGALRNAGMVSDNFVGVGHGMGGQFLQSYFDNSKDLKAAVMMGTNLDSDVRLKDFPVPVLTLAAQLDGLTRLTRIAEEYGELREDLGTSFLALYQTPVIVVPGANHAQFASGNMPHRIQRDDLEPAITEDEAHKEVAKHMDSFLTSTFSSSADQEDRALAFLEEAYFDTDNMLQPFLDIAELDKKGNTSPWAILAQEYIAGDLAAQIEVSNQVGVNPWFFRSNPSIRRKGDVVVVDTTALVYYKDDGVDLSLENESPAEINLKLKTKGAISDALAKMSLKSSPKTCRDLNEYAFDIAQQHSSLSSKRRFLYEGRQIIFENDTNMWLSPLWAATPLNTWVDERGLHIKSIAFKTSENLFCKVVSPSRLMEWMNIDSLRKN